MNPSLFLPAMKNTVGQNKLSSIGYETGLGEGKILNRKLMMCYDEENLD